jgi:hypothetical protein
MNNRKNGNYVIEYNFLSYALVPHPLQVGQHRPYEGINLYFPNRKYVITYQIFLCII